MTSLPPALVLGIDNAIGLTVIRELGQHGVPVHGITANLHSIGAASRHCRQVHVRPEGSAKQWLPALIERTGARAVLAISETDLIDLADLPPRIGDCHILVPRLDRLADVLDKRRTLDIAKAAGIKVPATWQPVRNDDFATRIAEQTYPLIAKWANPPAVIPLLDRAGLPWFKTEYIHTARELDALLARYTPIGEWPLVQQYCSGVGVGQMLYMHEGHATLRFQHRRLHEWPPEGGVSTSCRAEPASRHASQMDLSEKLLRALDWQGQAMVEYRYDAAQSRYWLMEVNGRFWGSLPLAHHCGAHFAWEAYRRHVLGQTDAAKVPRDDLKARYMVPESKRLLRVLLAQDRIEDPFFETTPWRDLLDYAAGFVDPRSRYYVFSGSDWRPFAQDLWQMARKALRLEKR